MLLAERGPVEAEPLAGCGPLHAPEASQEVAFDATQVSVEATPSGTVVGLALKAISGAGVGPEPPAPPCPPESADRPELQPLANNPIASDITRLPTVRMTDPPVTLQAGTTLHRPGTGVDHGEIKRSDIRFAGQPVALDASEP